METSEAAERVVVILDGSRELNPSIIKWPLVGLSLKSGDKLFVVGVLHQVINPSTFSFTGARKLKAAEAWACAQAIELSKDLGFRRAIIEGDAQVIINKMSAPIVDQSFIRAIIQNVKQLKQEFASLSFTHTRRTQNVAAHILAKLGRSFATPMVWIEEAPATVEAAVARDRWWVNPPD